MFELKNSISSVFVFVLFLFPFSTHLNSQTNKTSIHVMGNGKMCVYGQGIDITKLYSGSYSSPSFIALYASNIDSTVNIISQREIGTAIWKHILTSKNKNTTSITDFVDSATPCFTRNIVCAEKIVFSLNLEKTANSINNSNSFAGIEKGNALLFTAPSGIPFYQTYVSQRIIYTQLLVKGNAKISYSSDKKNYTIECEPGKSSILIIGGNELPDVSKNTFEALNTNSEAMLERTRFYWKNFTSTRTNFEEKLSPNVPFRAKLIQTIDDVAVLLKCQQSHKGGVIAGYPYPMCYVRDQYGTSRGMLALGMNNEAKEILKFYWNIWKKYGYIHNAHAVDLDGVFHIHENDEVESPGLLIIQAFDYYKVSRDNAFIKEIMPMLAWAFDVQKQNLVDNMLPFNGDETYVAGGILPRSALNDGSAEATMLFIESGNLLTNWLKKNKAQSAKNIKEKILIIEEVKSSYKHNFFKNNTLQTNNPDRTKKATLPEFRHGVCEAADSGCLMLKYGGIVWTQKTQNNRYVCASCFSKNKLLPATQPKVFEIPSTVLLPFYMNINLIPFEKFRATVTNLTLEFNKKLNNTTKEKTNNTKTDITVGYDYGFLLSAQNCLKLKDAEFLYQKTLFLADSTGAWSEYYVNGNPAGTRCRPWESGINIEALINYALTK